MNVQARDHSDATKRPRLIVIHSYESYNLVYDANGNLIEGFNRSLEYDGWHRVSRVRQNSLSDNIIEEYTYDHEGNRIKKVEYNIDSSYNNRTTYYISDDFVNIRITNGTQYNETYYYLGDKLIGMKDGGGKILYYHPDHLGSTTLVTNQSGGVVEDNTYLPFGDIYSGDESERYLFTGQELDQGTGFYDYGARLYDARFMHFLQSDPIISEVYDPQSLNRYAYVLNNPYKYADPTGNDPFLMVAAGAGLAVGIIEGGIIYYQTRDLGKSFKYGAISGLATGLTIATLGFGSLAATSAMTGASQLAVVATTSARLFVIGQTADIATQRFVDGKSVSQVSESQSVISGFLNMASPAISKVSENIIDPKSTLGKISSETAQQLISDFVKNDIDNMVSNKETYVSNYASGAATSQNINMGSDNKKINLKFGFNSQSNIRRQQCTCGCIMSCIH